MRMNLAKISLMLALGITLCLPGLASAYTQSIPDTTLVQPYRGTSPSTYTGWTNWTDIIGDPISNWQLNKVDVTWTATNTIKMEIFTNYPQAGREGAGQADIALDWNRDGIFETGIKMSGISWAQSTTGPPGRKLLIQLWAGATATGFIAASGPTPPLPPLMTFTW